MKKFVDLMTCLFMAVGSILFFMTPFAFVKFYTANETIESGIESIMLAVMAMLLWPFQMIIGASLLILMAIGSVVVMATRGPTDRLQRYYTRIINVNIKFYQKDGE